LKILFLSQPFYPQIGGIEANTEVLAAAFTDAGHEVHLITKTADTTGKVFPYKVTRNPNNRLLVQEHRWADLVFENNPCFRLGWPALLFGRPTVIAINTWVTRADGRITLRDKVKTQWWLKRSKAVIAVSDAVRRITWPPATVIENPYRVNDFKIIPEILRNADFVFLGRLVSNKGADQAIRAIHSLKNTPGKDERQKVTPSLTIIGSGPDLPMLEGMVSELSLGDCVTFKGSLRGEALSKCLNQHRFMLVPSVWEEPFGNVVLEGMACGCVPIASDGGGLPEAVGNAGLTFRRNDMESLVMCIRRLINDPKLERRLRETAPAHLAAHHPQVISRKYLQVLEKAFNS
jgi:glycosyltransferase involved in cell wall biosynthesis